MKSVVGISLGTAAQDFEFTATFLGEKMHVRRLGTDGSTAKAAALIKQWDKKADAIGLGVLKDRYKAGAHRFVEKDSAKLKAVVTQVPVTIGARLGDILLEWAVRHAQIHARPLLRQRAGAVLLGPGATRSWRCRWPSTRPTCTLPTRCCSSACPSC